jgi:hypothetical protein
MFVSVTFALPITAPEESLTVPKMVPVSTIDLGQKRSRAEQYKSYD